VPLDVGGPIRIESCSWPLAMFKNTAGIWGARSSDRRHGKLDLRIDSSIRELIESETYIASNGREAAYKIERGQTS